MSGVYRQTWKHRDGDSYVPVFGDWFGNARVGYERHWVRLSEATGTVQAAVHFGLKAQGSDDFNIAVIRGGRVVALLWMGEDMAEEPDVLARIAEAVL